MKNLVVCIVILALGVFGPQQDTQYEPAWSLGLLLLLAFVGQQAARALRLPDVVGWVGAGLLAGPSLLEATAPARFLSLRLIYAAAALWVGVYVGSRVDLAGRRLTLRLPVTSGLVSLAVFATTGLTMATATDLPGWHAAFYAALFSLWGPFAISSVDRESGDTLFLGTLGTGFSLLLLTAVLLFLEVQNHASPASAGLAARIWLSLAAGAAGGEILWRLRLFAAPRPTFLAALGIVLLLGAMLVTGSGLMALLSGLAAGLVVSAHAGQREALEQTFDTLRPMVFPLFFALIGAWLDTRGLVTAPPLLWQLLLISTVIILLFRGFAPSLWPTLAIAPTRTPRVGWLLLPKGALLFDLTFTSDAGLAHLLTGASGELLRQVAMADILLFLLPFSAIAALVWRFTPQSTTPSAADPEPENASNSSA